MAQAVHAAFEFTRDHPEIIREWLLVSNYLIIVSVPDEDALCALIERAAWDNLARTAVREPDLDQQITAVALAPGADAKRLCANLPLALRHAGEPAMT